MQNNNLLLKLKRAYLLEDCQQTNTQSGFLQCWTKNEGSKICYWIQMLISPWEIQAISVARQRECLGVIKDVHTVASH